MEWTLRRAGTNGRAGGGTIEAALVYYQDITLDRGRHHRAASINGLTGRA